MERLVEVWAVRFLVAGASGRFFFNIIMNHVNGNTACLF